MQTGARHPQRAANALAVLLLHKFEGMSYEDIGEAMSLSTEAVKSLLARARENLRTQLEPHLKS